jgi:hypothetical protein
MRRVLGSIFTAICLLALVASLGVWLRTELLGRTEVFSWGAPGVFRNVELSHDDVKFTLLYDPGYAARPLQHLTRLHGWPPPPPPSAPTTLPPTSVTWVLPRPDGQFVPTREFRVLRNLGFEYAWFDGWYGPKTSLLSVRVSYFTVMLPAALVTTAWLVRAVLRLRRRLRGSPGICRGCGYDLRATPQRCPECGMAAPTAL